MAFLQRFIPSSHFAVDNLVSFHSFEQNAMATSNIEIKA